MVRKFPELDQSVIKCSDNGVFLLKKKPMLMGVFKTTCKNF